MPAGAAWVSGAGCVWACSHGRFGGACAPASALAAPPPLPLNALWVDDPAPYAQIATRAASERSASGGSATLPGLPAGLVPLEDPSRAPLWRCAPGFALNVSAALAPPGASAGVANLTLSLGLSAGLVRGHVDAPAPPGGWAAEGGPAPLAPRACIPPPPPPRLPPAALLGLVSELPPATATSDSVAGVSIGSSTAAMALAIPPPPTPGADVTALRLVVETADAVSDGSPYAWRFAWNRTIVLPSLSEFELVVSPSGALGVAVPGGAAALDARVGNASARLAAAGAAARAAGLATPSEAPSDAFSLG
jgi:hypothetical protein